jgi:hypothetical protein
MRKEVYSERFNNSVAKSRQANEGETCSKDTLAHSFFALRTSGSCKFVAYTFNLEKMQEDQFLKLYRTANVLGESL